MDSDDQLTAEDAIEIAEYVEALFTERLRRAHGGKPDDPCTICGHDALWHSPECQVCISDDGSTCRRFLQ